MKILLTILLVFMAVTAEAAVYRVEVDVSFEDQQDAIDLLNYVEDLKGDSRACTWNDGIRVIQKCRYHKCFHDENPPKQCGDYTSIDFKAAKETHSKTVLDAVKN